MVVTGAANAEEEVTPIVLQTRTKAKARRGATIAITVRTNAAELPKTDPGQTMVHTGPSKTTSPNAKHDEATTTGRLETVSIDIATTQ